MEPEKNITRIAVVSDTHMPTAGTLPIPMLSELESMDLIIHLGDFCDIETYKHLQKIAPLIAVYGNMGQSRFKSPASRKKENRDSWL